MPFSSAIKSICSHAARLQLLQIWGLALDASANLIYCGSGNKTLAVVNTKSGDVVEKIPLQGHV